MSEFGVLSAPGVEARAYRAGEASGGAGVVVLHAWWGLNADVIAFADRLAAAGYAVVAPDLYHGDVVDSAEAAEARRDQLDGREGVAIVGAALEDLAARLGPGARLAVLGFSLGSSFALAAAHPAIAGTVLYYGTADPADATGSAPVLGHFAALDPYEEDDWVDQFGVILRSLGHQVTIHRYPATGHWFAEPSREAYRAEAAEQAWQRTLAFLERVLHH